MGESGESLIMINIYQNVNITFSVFSTITKTTNMKQSHKKGGLDITK